MNRHNYFQSQPLCIFSSTSMYNMPVSVILQACYTLNVQVSEILCSILKYICIQRVAALAQIFLPFKEKLLDLIFQATQKSRFWCDGTKLLNVGSHFKKCKHCLDQTKPPIFRQPICNFGLLLRSFLIKYSVLVFCYPFTK